MRQAVSADTNQILNIIRAKAEFDGCADTLRTRESDIKEAFFSQAPKAHALVVVEADEIIGIATYYSIYSTFIAKPGIWLDDLFIYPQYRSKGIGEALLSALCNVAEEAGCSRIDWIVAQDNEQGKRFYENVGACISESVRHARLDEAAIKHLADKSRNKGTHSTSM
ncbi:GNAT family N-acetyltransferase [Rheinheimera sp. EpRS3]|uniref:GNAT family N-acetyltransferase n=1 Tax=Rheinheimera sp. EpRS3 TaxID=1712383 RepID=UPI002F3EE451